MNCKFEHIIDFFHKYPQLLKTNNEQDLKKLFETFPHACKFVKALNEDIVDCNNLEVVSKKTLELLDNAYDHEYKIEDITDFAKAICKVFDIVDAPKNHVPFILVMLSRL
ncbi:hypothetical protein [Halarcobacter ebronensis]|uniref:Uncharacterized protein n=1 Tax=Halarcobacter ebronensis TaxID=1462615 RepID=A0A4Q1ARG6_9BACT|nr:hypothetical protein [Halarcobacter ebronensis]QKF82224.1 hypothetical protein AEBR_1742 [Halarcobacter ebronensis]RXK03400.1 hypothetical protein CRV07_12010 [Halarcobacter ebronensis]